MIIPWIGEEGEWRYLSAAIFEMCAFRNGVSIDFILHHPVHPFRRLNSMYIQIITYITYIVPQDGDSSKRVPTETTESRGGKHRAIERGDTRDS